MAAKPFCKGLKEGFEIVGKMIANIINTVLLLVIYFVGIGLAALFVKLAGQDLMPLENKDAKSYYSEKNIEKGKIDDYYNQF